MAQTPEGKVKSWLRGKMKEWYPNAWHYPCPGGPFGKVGAPDDIWIIGAGAFTVLVAIESKADDGVPTSAQWRNLLQIKENGGISATMVGRDIGKLTLVRAAIEAKRAILLEIKA